MASTVTPGKGRGAYEREGADQKVSRNRRAPSVVGVPAGSPMAQNGRVQRGFGKVGRKRRRA